MKWKGRVNDMALRLARWTDAAPARVLAATTVGVLATLLAVLFYSATWRTGDDGRYYALGMSIAEGAGLVQRANPMQPPEALTPPAYPALIATVIHASGNPVVWLKRMGNLLFVWAAVMAALTLMGSGEAPSRAGLMGACMGLFAVGPVSIASFVMADTLFLLLAFVCLWMSGRRPQGWWSGLVLGVCCGLAYLTRVAGLALVAALVIHALARKEWRQLGLFALGLVVVVGPWYYWKTFVVHLPEQYVALVERHAEAFQGTSLWANFPMFVATELFRDIPGFLVSAIPSHFFYSAEKVAFGGDFWRGVACLVGVGSSIGFLLRIRRWTAVDYFFIFSLLLIAVIPGAQITDRNYFFPVLPMAAFYFFCCMERVAQSIGRRPPWRRGAIAVRGVAVGVFCFSLLLDFGAGAVHFMKENPRRPYAPWAPERFQAFHNDYDDAWARVSEAAAWIREHTPEDAVLLSRKPDHLLVMSGRQGWRYEIPAEVQCETIMDSVEKFAPTRMVLLLEDAFPANESPFGYGNNRKYVLDETVRKFPERWREVYSVTGPVTRVWAYAGAAGEPTGK